MEQGENKRKHLDYIQGVINRMSSNSFLLKGWSISIITAIIGFAITINNHKESAYLVVVAVVLILVFWLLDAYYLSQERAYRALYSEVIKKAESEINFSLDARHHNTGYASWSTAMTSHIFLVFYAPAFFILLIYCTNMIGIDVYIK